MAIRRCACLAAVVLIGVLGVSTVVSSQTTTATIRGTVVDQSGGGVPDAQVLIVDPANGLRRTTASDTQGRFVIALVPPGRYRLSAQRTGFATAEVADVVLNVGDDLETQLLLKVAGLDAAVTVTAQPPRISTLPAVGTVVDRQFVANLPLNGRSFQSLITMTPGVVLTAATATSPGQFSVNGQRADANYFMIDGVSANVGVQPAAGLGVQGAGAAPGLSAQGGTNGLVSVDAMQEFKIQSSTYAPEFGRMPGGQISIVTRSGTNQRHGSLFEYFRNDALDAADYFVKRQGLAKPKERQHDFGGTIGGPLERDRMFVFASYEGLRLDQPRSAVTEVPSLASRQAASDAVRPIITALPLPNGPDTANGLARFSASYSDPSTLDATSIRVDRTFGSALTVFGRYNYAPSEGSSRLGSFAIAGANTVGWVQTRLHTLTTGVTWIIRPTVSNELRVNWSRNAGANFQTLDTFGGAVVPSSAMLHPAFAPLPSDYRVSFGPANVFFDDGANASNVQRQVNIVDGITVTSGRHQAKAGIDYRRLLPVYGPVRYVQIYSFSGIAGALAGTASSVTLASTSASNHSSHLTNFSVYAQDTWSAASSLTLTYGVRWDINPPPGLNDSDQALTLTNADPSSMAIAAPGTPMYRTTYNNVAPRAGAAYRLRETPGREMLLRGGWGVFFDLGSGPVMENLGQTFPFTARRTLSNVPFPADPSVLASPTVAPGAPADFLTAADPTLRLPYTYQWNVAVEQALGMASSLSVSYVGANGRRLLREERLINPAPQFQNLTLVTNHGHSRYESLQVKFVRRFSKGLQALLSYTLARSNDNISNDTIAAPPSYALDPEQDWGPSDFDVRHTFSGGATYALPAPPSGSAWHGVASGWSVDAIVVARSALPVNVVTGTTVLGVSNVLRPDLVPNVGLYLDDANVPGGQRFNPAAFTLPSLGPGGNPRQGTLPRNALRGFAMSQVDIAVRRDIPIHGVNLQLRAEAFNLFDQVAFGSPTNTLNSGLFGQPTRTLASSLGGGGIAGGGFNPLYQAGGPRSIQLALKFAF